MTEFVKAFPRWVDAFPWLDRARAKASIRDESQDLQHGDDHWVAQIESSAAAFNSHTQQVAGLASSQFPLWTLEQLLPSLPLETLLKDAEIHGVDRESEIFTRNTKFEDISDLTIDELERNNYLKVRSLPNFISSLVALNAKSESGETLLPSWRKEVRQQSAAVVASHPDERAFSSRGPVFDSAVLNAIDVVLRWKASNGEADSKTITINPAMQDTDIDIELSEAIKLLESLSGSTWAGGETATTPVFELLETFLEPLDLRSLRILECRVLSQPKVTLDALGEEYGLTRERIRQLEAILMAQLAEWFASDPDVQIHSEHIRRFTGKLNTLTALLSAFPALTEQVTGVNLPSWYVFDQFDDSFESDGKWVAVTSLRDVGQEFDDTFDAYADEEDFLLLDQLEIIFGEWGNCTFDELSSWAASRGYSLLHGALLAPRVRSMNDLAYVVLSVEGKPITSDVLQLIAAPEKSSRSFSNALSSDARMTRVGNDSWALSSWGLTGYQGIRNEILSRVDAAGSASITQLVTELSEKFGVSPNSVRTYAASWPLKTVGDTVTRAIKPAAPTRPLYRSKGVFFIDGGLGYRVLVNSEHLRGSGFPLPSALAGALGVTAGEVKSFPLEDSESQFTIRWPGPQPQASSIRGHLVERDIQEGAWIAITFIGGQVSFLDAPIQAESPESRIRAICLMQPETVVNRKSIATSLGLPSTSLWHEVIDLVNLRKEPELIQALEELISSLE